MSKDEKKKNMTKRKEENNDSCTTFDSEGITKKRNDMV